MFEKNKNLKLENIKSKLKIIFVKKENIYLILALTLGLFMAVFNPPFAGVPDEHAHYWKAWSVAEGYWRCTGEDKIPLTAKQLPDQIKPIKYEGIKDNKIVVALLKEKLFEKDNQEKAVIGGAVCPATPFGYFVPASALLIGRNIGFSALADLYLARIVALLISVFIFYQAIRIVPFGKMIFLLLGLFPMTIRQMASLSYDGLQIAFAVLFLAYILKLANKKDNLLNKAQMVLLLFLSLFGLNVKGSFALTILIFILPFQKFKKKWQYWTFTVGFVLINMLMVFGIRATFFDRSIPQWTDPSKQIGFVLSAPLHFINVALESYLGAGGLIPHFDGIIFKTGTSYDIPGLFYVLVFLGILIFIRNQEEHVDLSRRQRFVLFVTFLASFFIIYLALYLSWSKPGAIKVSGVQGRYFLSIIPLFIFSFYKSGFSLKLDFVKKHQNLLLLIYTLVVFWMVFYAMYQARYLKEKLPSNPVYEQFLKNNK